MPDLNKKMRMKVNALNYVTEGMLSIDDNDKK